MINILYEDNHLLVVEKKPGILSQSDGSNNPDMLTLLKKYLKEKYNKKGNVYLGLVHRLDKQVGGVMVFAKTSKAAKRLSEQIRNHEVLKEYMAVVNGVILEDGEFIDYLGRDEYRSYITNSNRGKIAKLEYRVLYNDINETLVKVKLITGRYHQIRVQFSARGHFLLGDAKYGVKGKYPIALFAYHLSFFHPVTKEKMNFELLPSSGYFKK